MDYRRSPRTHITDDQTGNSGRMGDFLEQRVSLLTRRKVTTGGGGSCGRFCLQDGKSITGKKNYVWTCNTGTKEHVINDSNAVAIMRITDLEDLRQ
jgi:hypothetical protein